MQRGESCTQKGKAMQVAYCSLAPRIFSPAEDRPGATLHEEHSGKEKNLERSEIQATHLI